MKAHKKTPRCIRFTWQDPREQCPKCGGRNRKLVDTRMNWQRGILTEKSRCSHCGHKYVSSVAGGKVFKGDRKLGF